MKFRPARGVARCRRLIAAMVTIAIIVTVGWYITPLVADRLLGTSLPMQTVYALDDVNLRSGPGTTFDILTVVPAGNELSAERESVNGYSAVRVNGMQGWVATPYLAEPNVAYAAEYAESGADTEPVAAGQPLVAFAPPSDPVTQPAMTAPAVETAPVVDLPTAVPVLAQTTQVAPEPQPGEKWIEVDRTTSTVTLHNGEIIVASFPALIGKDLSADGYYSTAIGTHYVHVKEKALVETPFAEGVYLTDFVGFDPQRSNGFHSPTRDAAGNVVVTGGTATLGCVRLSATDAQILFDFATIGMRVDVHD